MAYKQLQLFEFTINVTRLGKHDDIRSKRPLMDAHIHISRTSDRREHGHSRNRPNRHIESRVSHTQSRNASTSQHSRHGIRVGDEGHQQVHVCAGHDEVRHQTLGQAGREEESFQWD